MSDTIKPPMHGRDHCPGGSDPIPCFGHSEWGYAQMSSSATINDNTLTTITFGSYAIDPDATAIASYQATAPLALLSKGFYLFHLQTEWVGADYTDERLAEIHIASGGGWWENNDTTYNPRDIQSGQYGAGQTKALGPLLVDPTARIAVRVKQMSGVSKDIESVRLTALYLGPSNGLADGELLSDLLTAF